MISTPFHHLQSASHRQDVPASQVMRAAIVLAGAVQDHEALTRFRKEASGYETAGADPQVPEHRMVHVRLMADDRWGRCVPVHFKDAASHAIFSAMPVAHGLGALETLLRDRSPTGVFEAEFAPKGHESMLRAIPDAVRVFRSIQVAQFALVLEAARQSVFDWATEMIQQGMSCPDGVSLAGLLPDVPAPVAAPAPSLTEADGPPLAPLIAKGGVTITANHSSVVFQSPAATSSAMHHEVVDSAAVKGLTDLLEELLRSKGTPDPGQPLDAGLAQLAVQLDELKTLMAMDKPRAAWVKDSLRSIRSIFENAAGSALATVATRPEVLAAIHQLLA